MRQTVRFTPKAKLSSLPLNQAASAVVMATMSDSAPMPKTRRPVAMIHKLLVSTVMMEPRKQSTPNMSVERAQSDAVNDDSANNDREDVGEAVSRLEQADVGVGEVKLLDQQVGDWAERVVEVVIAEHGQADENQHQPAVHLAGLRTVSDRQ